MVGAGLYILAEPLGDLFRRPVGDHGVDEFVTAGPGHAGVGEPSRFQLLT